MTLYNVQLWRDHAAHARALSAQITDHQTKLRILSIAAGYERIAELAAQLQSATTTAARTRRLTLPVLASLI
jgi:hypothetical protein